MSKPMSGVGTKFYKWSGSAWGIVAQINSISGPGMSRETIDVTTLDSVGGYREFISGIRNPGQVQLGMNFTATTYAAMKADFESDTMQNYKIELPDTAKTTLEFEGLVMEMPLSIEVADKISADVTIQISGKVEMYDGSSGGPVSESE